VNYLCLKLLGTMPRLSHRQEANIPASTKNAWNAQTKTLLTLLNLVIQEHLSHVFKSVRIWYCYHLKKALFTFYLSHGYVWISSFLCTTLIRRKERKLFPFGPHLKVLTNEKRGGLSVVSFDRSRFKLFLRIFSTNWCRPHPVRGIKLLCEPCSYYLQTIIDSQ
jgi:hypothetical protein